MSPSTVGPAHLETILENLPVVLWSWDPEGVFRVSEGRGLELLGLAPGEVVGRNVRDVYGDIPQVLRMAEAALTGRTVDTVVEVGSTAWSAHCRPVLADDGKLRAVVGVALEVTREEEARRRSRSAMARHARQQATVAGLGHLALSGVELDELFETACREVSATLGMPLVQVLELQAGEELLLRAGVGWNEGAVGKVRIDTDPAFQAGYTLLSARPLVVEDFGAEDRFRRCELLRSHDVASGLSVVIRGDPEPFGVLAAHAADRRTLDSDAVHFLTAVANILADAVARKEGEEALLRSEAAYRELVEHAAHGIYRSTAQGRFLSVNPALVQMLGYDSAEELLRIPVSDLYADPDERTRLVEAYGAERRKVSEEVEWIRKDGGPILVQLEGRVVRDPDGRVEGFEIIAEDVTGRRALEERLRQAQKMEAVGQLTAGISHDFNNLLTAILGHTDLMAHELPSEPASLREDLGRVRGAALRGARLVRKLMAFSRQQELEIAECELGALCRDALGLLEGALPETIELRFEASPEPLVVRADRTALEQILLNLATNARDAMPEGGELTLFLDRIRVSPETAGRHEEAEPGRFAVVSVRDTGEGMDESTRARVFDPFFTTKPAGEGTGLGMAMVYGLVRQHGGFVELDSTPGEGSTIAVHLPLVDGPEPS